MNPHPRIRKAVKWGGLALTVVLVGVWVGSGWYGGGWSSGAGEGIGINSGCVQVSLSGFPDPYGVVVTATGPRGWGCYSLSTSPRIQLRPFVHDLNGGFSHWFIPLWIPLAVVGSLSALAWWLDARARGGINLCPTCHYDRTGLASKDAVCPECGAAAPSGG